MHHVGPPLRPVHYAPGCADCSDSIGELWLVFASAGPYALRQTKQIFIFFQIFTPYWTGCYDRTQYKYDEIASTKSVNRRII